MKQAVQIRDDIMVGRSWRGEVFDPAPHASGLTELRVTLGESRVARAWCEANLA